MRLWPHRKLDYTPCRNLAHHCIYCCACDDCAFIRTAVFGATAKMP